ncbi:MAG: hypothetical protein LBN06_04745 [Prevotellaceae bacterium]|jgi:hypothetical protein|nr:hypothetical protein [Prevotellaceae bacterium]
MKPKDTYFSMSRFVNVCRKEMVENWKSYLLRLAMVYGAFAVILVWNGYFQYRAGTMTHTINSVRQFAMYTFVWLLGIMGMVSASFMMERMKTKTGRINTLMLPATPFEQFLARWLILTFGFLVAFVIVYTLGDWTRVVIYRIAEPSMSEVIQPVSLLAVIDQIGKVGLITNNLDVWSAIGFYLFWQSFFVLGSSLWPRHTLVRTFVAGIVLLIVYTLLASGTVYIFMPAHPVSISTKVSDETMQIGANILMCVMAVVNWTLAYFRFKEAEIINRW